MIHDKILRLKKYLFFISVFVFVPLFIHLVYIYLYNDSKLNIAEGGTVSEAIIGNFPSLNPLKSLSGDNKYVISLLYRSLLKYDVSEKKIVSDIVSCDLNNILIIKCYLKDEPKWSNGEKITIKDILSTYKIYKNTDINPLMSALLSNTNITEENNSIVFSSSEAHIKFLDIFFSPIVPEDLTNQISFDDSKIDFISSGSIYSGKYVIESFSKNNEDGISKLSLIKNKNYNSNSINIDKLVLNFFPSSSDFKKYKDSINIFNDDNNILGDSVPRLKNNPFYLPQYVSLFINKDNIADESLRNYIFNKINRENLLKILGEQSFKELKNPYLTDISIDKEINDKNINKILSNLGYYRKSDLLGKIISENKIYSTGGQISTGSTFVENKKSVENQVYTIDKFQKKSNLIIDPNFIEKYNFITKDNILLKGVAGNNITEVYVNDYKLNGFKSGNDIFYYRIREGVGNIKQGINKYKIEFVRNGKKELVDEIYFIYYKNKVELEKEKEIFIKSLYGVAEKKIESQQSSIDKINQDAIKIKNEKVKKENDEKIKKISLLEEKYFYNDKLEKLTFNLMYVNSSKDMELTSNYIKSSLESEGITVNFNTLTIEKLAEIISKDDVSKIKNNNYDMILVAINLGNFDFDIFSYFHSSKVNHKPRSNFSKIKKSDLDVLLEELESKYLPKDKINDLEKNVLEILKQEQVVKVLYTPLINNLVDKNINNYKSINYIPDKSFRSQLTDEIYIVQKKILNLKDKGFIGFIKFLLKSLNE